ncbi:MAG: hypothetical protein FJW30_21660 [Acidobacteria bacterium]|nr:hypothetical protein [Acidobacteriota bacterium]
MLKQLLAIGVASVSTFGQTPKVESTAARAGVEKLKGGVLPPDVARNKALAVPAGAPLTVKVAGRGPVKGTLQDMTSEGIKVRTETGGIESIAFDQISSLKKGKPNRMAVGTGMPKALDTKLGDIPAGTPVTLTLADKTQVSGRYAGKSPDGVKVQVPGAGDSMITRTIPHAELARVKRPKGKLPGLPSLQSPVMVRKSLLGIPVGSPVALNMPGGSQLTGKLMGVTADGFSLQTFDAGNLVTKNLQFDQIASVKRPSPGFRGRIPGLKPPGLQTPEVLKTKALAIPAGTPLTVTLPDGTKSTGKLMGTTNEGMRLQRMEGGELKEQTLGFDEVGSIKKGVPVTPAGRFKGVSKTVITMAITAAVTGFISGKIAK